MPADHPAIEYVRGRGYCPETLARRFGVGFITESPLSIHRDRLLIPVYRPSELVGDGTEPWVLGGWQARAIEEAQTAKYRFPSGMRKSSLLYGLPALQGTPGPVALVEGVTDVWRVPGPAVALFGKTISQAQLDLARKHLAGRPLVVLLDAAACEESRQLHLRLRQARHAAGDSSPVHLGRLPEGRDDPGECTEAELEQVIADAIRPPQPQGNRPPRQRPLFDARPRLE